MAQISLFKDMAYGKNAELALFDQENHLIATIKSKFCRLSPQKTDTGEQVLVMTRSIDEETNEQFDPVITWYGSNEKERELFNNMQFLLDINYRDFILLANLRHGIDSILLDDLFIAGKKFGAYGYITQVFQAEIIYRLFSLIVFLPAAVIIIVLGWRFRAKNKPLFMGIPMLFILPLVFQGIIRLYQSLLNTLSIWSVTSFGFTISMTLFSIGTVFLFFLSLLIAAFQKEE
jgi:hypothetical protein